MAKQHTDDATVASFYYSVTSLCKPIPLLLTADDAVDKGYTEEPPRDCAEGEERGETPEFFVLFDAVEESTVAPFEEETSLVEFTAAKKAASFFFFKWNSLGFRLAAM